MYMNIIRARKSLTLRAACSKLFRSCQVTGTIDLCHFAPFSVAHTLAEGHKVSENPNTFGVISCTLRNPSG